jgi:hypothetical protein
VVGDFDYNQAIRDSFHFRGNDSGITTLAAHQQILKLAKDRGREVWFDAHVGTEGPRPHIGGLFDFVDALQTLSDGAKHRVVVFELNANNHEQRRALANAAAVNAIARDGRIPVVCSANALQPDGQNDNGWNQGLLFLNQTQTWLQPPGCVVQMFAQSYLPLQTPCTVTAAGGALDAAAQRSQDGRKLSVRVVNFADQPVSTDIQLSGFAPASPEARVTELSAPLAARNTAVAPRTVAPVSKSWRHGFRDGAATRVFPPHSVTVIEWQ